mgnify:CR=1 FL=1
MRKHFAAAALALMTAACIAAPDMAAIEAEVARFHERQAASEDAAIYAAAAQGLRDAATLNDLQRLNSAVRGAQCEPAQRDPNQWHNNMSTSGHFITVVYQRQCQGGGLTETFRFVVTPGGPQLLNYNAAGMALFPQAPAPAETAPENTPPATPPASDVPTTPT